MAPQAEIQADTAASTKQTSTTTSYMARETAGDKEADTPEGERSNGVAERLTRFKALQARQALSKKENLKESQQEAQRLGSDPNLMTSLNRKHAIASHKLLKAETEAAGADFERKLAWDWTIEETEKWDKRMEKKKRHRDNVAFQDYTAESRKVYKRQMRDFKPNLEAYQREKMDAIQKAADNGGLDIIETEDGELIAVDRDGTFYSTTDTANMQKKPDKAAVDRLVANLEKAEQQRMKNQRERLKNTDESGDITYINIKNKHFNEKLRRFYDKYTTSIRESFERGTAV